LVYLNLLAASLSILGQFDLNFLEEIDISFDPRLLLITLITYSLWLTGRIVSVQLEMVLVDEFFSRNVYF